jgi:hypothetical protein
MKTIIFMKLLVVSVILTGLVSCDSCTRRPKVMRFDLRYGRDMQGRRRLMPWRDSRWVCLGDSGRHMQKRDDTPVDHIVGVWHDGISPPSDPVYFYYESTLELRADSTATFREYVFGTAKGVDRMSPEGADAPFKKSLAIEMMGHWSEHVVDDTVAVLELRAVEKLETSRYWRESGSLPHWLKLDREPNKVLDATSL